MYTLSLFSLFHLGELNLTLGTRETIDTALLFLYGKCPKLTNENIYHMFDLAEFLMIPNLKSLCCKWIQAVDINEENVETLLHITSLFDFEINTLTQYVRQHLTDLFAGDKLLSLTPDSIEFLLMDQTLSYVTSDERLLFVLKWAQHSLEKRSAFLLETSLVKLIDVSKITNDALAKAKQMESYSKIKSYIGDETMNLTGKRKVLVSVSSYKANKLWIYDIEKQQWFGVHLENVESNTNEIQAFSNDSSVLYLRHDRYKETELCIVDLASLKTEKTVLVDNTGADVKKSFDKVLLPVDGECYAVGKTDVVYERSEEERLKLVKERDERQRLIDMFGPITFHDVVNAHWFRQCTFKKYSVSKSHLLAGHILPTGNESEIPLTPLISFNEKGNMDIVANGAKLIAARSENKSTLYIYDLLDCKITKFSLQATESDILTTFHDGFVIYNDSRIVYVRTYQGPFVKRRFKMYETKLSDGVTKRSTSENLKYIPKGKMWIRYPKYMLSSINIEFTHAELGIVHPDEAKWTTIKKPKDRISTEEVESIHEMVVPQSLLKCNIDCPHCDRLEEEKRKYRRSITKSRNADWSTEDEDSDDDRFPGDYVPRYYYDDDDYYYYDSD